MKDIEKPAKRIFSQNKGEKFVKTHKFVVEKTLGLIAVENPQKKRKITNIDEKRKKKKKDTQNVAIQNPTKTLKSLSSDQKRLESLKEWQKQLNQQKSTLKNALSINNVSNKRVIFDDEESEINTTPELGKPKPLFDESSLEGSDSEEKLDEIFRYKKEFEGKSGKKLKELQKKYGNDDRFKLSENFLDDEDMKDTVEELADNEDPDGIKDEEIENTLKIADQILQNNEIRVKSKTNKIFKDVSALRFDPDKTIHKELIQSPKKTSKKKSVAVENTNKNKKIPTLPEVKKSLYYEVETSLKEAFTHSTEQPFSLLASFSNPDVPLETEISNDEEEEEKETVLENPHRLEDNEISSCDELENGNDPLTEVGLVSVESETIMEYPDKKFFFLADDKRLTEGVKLFHRTITEEEMWNQWKAKERKIKMLFHTRQKHIVRRLNYKKSAGSSNKTFNKNKN